MKMTQRYIREIPIPHAQPVLAFTPATVFMEDNAHTHRAGEVKTYLTEIGISRLVSTGYVWRAMVVDDFSHGRRNISSFIYYISVYFHKI